MNVTDGQVGVHFYFGKPRVIGKRMLEFLPCGVLIYERSNIFGLFLVEPRESQKGAISPLSMKILVDV
jgi:hypothetical protein